MIALDFAATFVSGRATAALRRTSGNCVGPGSAQCVLNWRVHRIENGISTECRNFRVLSSRDSGTPTLSVASVHLLGPSCGRKLHVRGSILNLQFTTSYFPQGVLDMRT
jgi:hypothetical protein